MKLLFKSILLVLTGISFAGCCELEHVLGADEEKCYEIFLETKNVPVSFIYQMNTNQPFNIAKSISSADVARALKEDDPDLTIKEVNLTKANIKYTRDPSNTADSFRVNIRIIQSGIQADYLLFKENKAYSLTPTDPLLGVSIPVNLFLNTVAVTALKKVIKDYGTQINQGSLFFNLVGEGLPTGKLLKFELMLEFTFSIKYEVCRFVPMGSGIRRCD